MGGEEKAWVRRMAKRFGMESTLRPRGRPKASYKETPWTSELARQGFQEMISPDPTECRQIFPAMNIRNSRSIPS